jgi:hypothetical protein
VEAELKLLKNGLSAIVQAFATHNLTLHSVILQVFLVFPEEVGLKTFQTATRYF